MDEEANRDENGEADGMNLEVDSKDEVMHSYMSDLIFIMIIIDDVTLSSKLESTCQVCSILLCSCQLGRGNKRCFCPSVRLSVCLSVAYIVNNS